MCRPSRTPGSYSPFLGLVLTGATPERIKALITERVKRQELLYQPGRHMQIVLGEATLTVHFGAVDTLLGQLDRQERWCCPGAR
ncbi:MAG: Scr1 family TA system antitoxin-like transcriptional regulator [Pseudonocardiaceae bacterium]